MLHVNDWVEQVVVTLGLGDYWDWEGTGRLGVWSFDDAVENVYLVHLDVQGSWKKEELDAFGLVSHGLHMGF